MPVLLLPRTAEPFAPRSSPTIVLNSNTKVDAWLTLTLKRINRIKRPLNSVPQHKRCLLETLGLPTSLWHLCTLFVSRSPSSQINGHENHITDAFERYTPLHIEAYVVHVDLVLSHEVAFKLTRDCILELTEYHKHTFLPDQSESLYEWADKPKHLEELHKQFVQAVNSFVFRTPAIVLEGLEEDGAGELLRGKTIATPHPQPTQHDGASKAKVEREQASRRGTMYRQERRNKEQSIYTQSPNQTCKKAREVKDDEFFPLFMTLPETLL